MKSASYSLMRCVAMPLMAMLSLSACSGSPDGGASSPDDAAEVDDVDGKGDGTGYAPYGKWVQAQPADPFVEIHLRTDKYFELRLADTGTLEAGDFALTKSGSRRYIRMEYGNGNVNRYQYVVQNDLLKLRKTNTDTWFEMTRQVVPGCIFGEERGDIEESRHFKLETVLEVTANTTLEAATEKQLIAAVDDPAVTTIAKAFERTDDGVFETQEVTHLATNHWFTVVWYYAGDNAVGAIFVEQSSDKAATISDDWIKCKPAP